MTSEPPIGSSLLTAARDARAHGDVDRMQWALRARATLPHGANPEDLRAECAVAELWAGVAGAFHLYASRVGADRVRVGFEDPARIVGRVIVTVRDGARERRLLQTESHAPDRREFTGEIPPGAEIAVDALMTRLGGEILIQRAILEPVAAIEPPAPPAATAARKKPAVSEGPAETAADVALPWWWLAAGVVAVALTGAAIWQETR